MSAPTVVAFVPDLMDRSRLPAGVEHVTRVEELTGRTADVYLVDLGRPGALDVAGALDGRVIGFAAHVDDGLLAAARAAGVEAMPRSRFFVQVRTLLGGGGTVLA
jgi:hypothetical protein